MIKKGRIEFNLYNLELMYEGLVVEVLVVLVVANVVVVLSSVLLFSL